MNMQQGSENYVEIQAVVNHRPNTCSSNNKLPSAGLTGSSANCHPNTITCRHAATCYHCGESGHSLWTCLKRLHEKRLLLLHNSQSKWSDIPTDILSLVIDRLPMDDLIRMASVCKLWRQDIRLLPRRVASMPWLVHYDHVTSRLELSDIRKNQTFVINTDSNEFFLNYNMRECEICDSKCGWLLLLFKEFKREFEVDLALQTLQFVYYNPFQNKIIKLPLLHSEEGFGYIYKPKFMMTPTCGPPSCGMIFLQCEEKYRIECAGDIYTYNRRDRRWSVAETTIPARYRKNYQFWDMAYMDGNIICISNHHPLQLAMCNLSMPHQDWTLMDYSLCLEYHDWRFIYLVEIGGDLLLATYNIRWKEDFLRVYEFDRSQNEWTQIKSLGNWVMILCQNSLASIMIPAEGEAKEFANMIFHNHQAFISETTGIWKEANPQWFYHYDCIFIEPEYHI